MERTSSHERTLSLLRLYKLVIHHMVSKIFRFMVLLLMHQQVISKLCHIIELHGAEITLMLLLLHVFLDEMFSECAFAAELDTTNFTLESFKLSTAIQEMFSNEFLDDFFLTERTVYIFKILLLLLLRYLFFLLPRYCLLLLPRHYLII